MVVKDLRIGNYVWDNYSGEMIVFGLSANNKTGFKEISLKKTEKMPSGLYYIKDINPIPLTEQWMKDFNYNNEGIYWYNKDRSYRIHKIANTWVIERHYVKFQHEEQLISEWVFIADIQYVHSLQNLYWCLCEKELTKKQKI